MLISLRNKTYITHRNVGSALPFHFTLICFLLLFEYGYLSVDALLQIATTMGAKYWSFEAAAGACRIDMVGVTEKQPKGSQKNVDCVCNFENNTVCHVVKLMIKGYSLPGMLPPQLVRLPYLQEIDFSYNYLNGTIPREWASMKLTYISVLANRLSGKVPKELGNITTLTFLNLEANQFSGILPAELGHLVNLQTLSISSNQLTGSLPQTFSGLRNIRCFRMNDNNFNGPLPDWVQNWKQLKRLEMHSSGLEGPIPSNISLLNNLTELRISDTNAPSQEFPTLRYMTGLVTLILRNCNISGEIPAYIWSMKNLEMLDLSFNKLVGKLPSTIGVEHLKFVFLTGNLLSGNVPKSMLREGSNVDLSYNNFTLQGPKQLECQEHLNLNLNLYRSSSKEDNLRGVVPCLKNFKCPRSVSKCMHINCGGSDVIVKDKNHRNVTFEGDGGAEGGSAKYFRNEKSMWGFSSTGDFMDDSEPQNTRYSISLVSSNLSELYTTARLSPLSLTYFHYCLENGIYTITLHFAEIMFTNEERYSSLGRRIFDVYVQERLVWKDFNIEYEAGMAHKRLVKKVSNVNVTSNVLEIRFYWAGKGTMVIPEKGNYGPLISAISVVSDIKPCKNGGTVRTNYIIARVGVGTVGGLCLTIFMLAILRWKGCLGGKRRRQQDIVGRDMQTRTFTLEQIKADSNNFDSANKIGEGGFGPVYKGQLPDGSLIAIKQLSSNSRQGNREFVNEMGLISCLQHPNIVKLHGYCIEEDHLLLVYEYMENNSLAHALFNQENHQIKLDWPTRFKICIGIARGLAFLHEESRIKIVHRDIKATNVLLDADLNPKISDFGLAKLYEEEKTHISTKVAGTIGYMAPEYALWGHLTNKADVYSFGVVALEIASGKKNNHVPNNICFSLLDWAYELQQTGNLKELIDESLGNEVNDKEAEVMVNVILLCTNVSPSLRPTMSEVVSMLEGQTQVPDIIPDASTYAEDLRFKSMRDVHHQSQTHSSSGRQSQNSATVSTFCSSSSSHQAMT
ncbi:probable LRR receptor-like serine/threonine-protein kinase RFK1 isoform X2 [Malus sylvestris]|uniref:probable LRR receptor-like serine/threonine-protein kinase RFK1 isoform X2 n=2 Tax=Malus sylvestris TaxID=3752 RepID=UPI0021AD07EE|nr:probable LRR receptor-like serine/threonine-protein kinase RFK1 isoform X2 [Malus sylvestris]